MKKLYTIALSIFGILAAGTALAQTVTLKAGTTTIGTYNTLQAAYNAIPTTLSQAYTIEIQSTYSSAAEVFPVTFTNKAGASSTNTITIKPAITPVTSPIQVFATTTSSIFEYDNADWIVFDGINLYDPVTGTPSVIVAFNPIGTGVHQGFHFKNGSSNNVVKNILISGSTGTDCVLFGQSPATSGNSDNTITGCYIGGASNCINSVGTVANPNRNLTIAGNYIYTERSGIRLAEGTGKVVIDSNTIEDDGIDSTFGILHAALTDTLIATRNTIAITGHSTIFANAVPTRGIQVNSSANGANNYLYLANNMIVSGREKTIDVDTAYYEEDGLNDLAGIDIKGSKLTARILHNTVKLTGVLDPALTGTVVSAALSESMVGPGISYEMFGNIFTNERTGGNGLAQHVVVDMYTFFYAMFLEGNTYNTSSTGSIARVHNNIYTTLAAYKAQVSPTEFTTNDQPVRFADEFDLHLHHSMMGNLNITVNGFNVVPNDIDGTPRPLATQYRGADEYIVNCNAGTVDGGTVYGADSVCVDELTGMIAYDMGKGNGILYKWQSRPAHSSQPWVDIPGEDLTILRIKITQPTEFRFVDSCVAGGIARSQPKVIELFPKADITSVSDIHIGYNYVFTANGILPSLVEWDFGDGGTSSGFTNTASHNYSAFGTYKVRAVAYSNCGTDTMEYSIVASSSVNDIANGKAVNIYPNPTRGSFTIDCPAITDGDVQVSIISLTGARVYNHTVPANGKAFITTVDVSNLPAGMYMVELWAGDKVKRGNVVIQ